MKLNYWKILGALIVLLSGALVITAVAHASPSMRQVKAAVDPAFKQRRVSIAVLIVAAAADVLTTEIDLHRGCREGNPIYGPHPSLAPLLLTHAGIVAISMYGHTPAWSNYAEAALLGAVSLHNAAIRCH